MKQFLSGLFALLLFVGFAMNANAQETDDADIDVSASVVETITVNNITNLLFGNVLTGDIPEADPTDGTFDYDAGGDRSIGKFQVVGSPGTSTLVTWDAQITLDADDGTLPVDYNAIELNPVVSFQAGDQGAEFGGAVVGAGDQEHDVALHSSGINTYWVGGTLTEKETDDQVIPVGCLGLYEGEFTLTATYN